MDEEGQKRKTDCVYFLASPLTCKKGNDCEYRHSEAARINPRDCWFWLTGNCLNANCSFRHPPLDGRPAATTASAPLPTTVVDSAATASAPALSSIASKSRVPCFFFSQGFCAKGDKCPYMHGPAVAQSIKATLNQKPPKELLAKGAGDKPISVTKGNGSGAHKKGPQELPSTNGTRRVALTGSESAPLKAAVPPREMPVMRTDAERVRISGVTSAPSRHKNPIEADEIRQIHLLGGRSLQVHNSDDKPSECQSRKHRLGQPQPGDECLRQVQSANDRLQQGLSGEERKQHGLELEEWLKQASPGFDVLVDHGSDQQMCREDGEYISIHELSVESGRTRSPARMTDHLGMADFEYERSGLYDQSGYYNTSGKYEHSSYGHDEQQLGHDQSGPFDQVGRQHSVSFNVRTSKSELPRERRGRVLQPETHYSSGDLRNHLAKCRRSDRAQHLPVKSHSKRVHQGMADRFHHHKRHQVDHPKQQEMLIRNKRGIQSNHMRSSGRADSGSIKRAYHDVGSEAASSDRAPLKNLPNKCHISDLRLKLKDRDSGQYASEAASGSEARGSKRKKMEQKNGPSTFTGPKSLSQIKAEKRRAASEAGLKTLEGLHGPQSPVQSGTHHGFANQLPALVIKSQVSQVSGPNFDRVQKEGLSGEERKRSSSDLSNHETTKSPAFQAPKGLSSLKAKPGIQSDDNVEFEQTTKQLALRESSCTPGAKKLEVCTFDFPSLDRSKDIEDGEVLPDGNNIALSPEVAEGTLRKCQDSYDQYLSDNSQGLSPVLTSGIRLLMPESVQRNQGQDEINGETVSSDDVMLDGIETGDNASDGEYEFDDDEEDDFAKKLGGFFS